MTRGGTKKTLLRATATFCVLLALYLGILWFTLPDISNPKNLIASQSSVIVDRNGTELYRLYREEDRTFIEGAAIPKHLKNAVVAIEDERFYERGCIDIRAIIRAVLRLGQAGGASTLTRQLARNALDLKGQNIMSRKIRELILGCQLEATYKKEELLELYLNWIPFGQNAYGVEQASRTYFGVSASELTLAQSAILAALPQRPSYFTPYGKHLHTTVKDGALKRILAGKITAASQLSNDDVVIGLLGGNVGTGSTVIEVGGRTDQVLRNMQDLGFITEADRLKAREETEHIVFERTRENIRAPHFVLWMRQQVEDVLSATAGEGFLEQGGLRIETTLDWEMQRAAEEVIAFHREDMQKRFGAQNIALVALDPVTRAVRAYVGNADYDDEEHDGKVDMVRAPRQPGSSFKPFVYAAAFAEGYNPATVLEDVPTKIGDDEPQNFDGTFWGIMTIRRALAASRNIPAAKAFFLGGGEEKILDLVAMMGVTGPKDHRNELRAERGTFDYGWPLALGAAETPLLEMVQGYATFADRGQVRPMQTIRRILDSRGNIRYEAQEAEPEQVLDPRVAYQITSVLSDVGARPNAYWQSVLSVPGYQAAAKTGTSNKPCVGSESGQSSSAPNLPQSKRPCKILPWNLWTIGYTPMLAAGVWVGNADGSALSEKAESLSTAAPIWRDFMARAHKLLKSPVTNFPVPEGIVQPQISLLSGELPTECTPVELRKADVFRADAPPNLDDPACISLEVDRVTGTLASDSCPAEARELRSFYHPKVILGSRFPEWQKAVEVWANEQTTLWYARPDHSGSLLPLPLAPTVECQATPERLQKPRLEIIVPSGGGLVPYPTFRPELKMKVGSWVQELRIEIDGKLVERFGSGTLMGTGTICQKDMTNRTCPLLPVIQVPRSIDQGGIHSLSVTLVDKYFNMVTQDTEFRFGIDRTAPQLTLLFPRGDISLPPNGTVTMKADAEDEGGVKYVEFFLENRLLSRSVKAPYELQYSLKDVKPGSYTLTAKATDFAGNESEESVHLTVAP